MLNNKYTAYLATMFWLLLLFCALSLYYWYFYQYPVTKDAYVDSDVSNISSINDCMIEKVFVHNNQFVKKGDKLFACDTIPFKNDLAQKVAQLKILQLATTQTSNEEKLANIAAAQAAVKQAQYELDNAVVIAPHDGTINNLSLHAGDYINAGPLFALIANDNWRIIANFRETVLRLIHVNDKVKVTLDLYPGVTFDGVVTSMSRGINRRETPPDQTDSMLEYVQPKEDWVRLSQRFPVEIKLDAQPDYPLYVGASAKVSL